MKKQVVVMIHADRSTGISALGAEFVGEALGAATLLTTDAALITAGVLSAGAVAAGSKTETTIFN